MSDEANQKLAVRPAEAARMLSISTRTLWSLTAPRGPIPASKLKQGVLYRIADLIAFLDASTIQAPTNPESN